MQKQGNYCVCVRVCACVCVRVRVCVGAWVRGGGQLFVCVFGCQKWREGSKQKQTMELLPVHCDCRLR